MRIERKKLGICLMAALIMVLTMTISVSAGNDVIEIERPDAYFRYTEGTIRPDLKGSITIYKFDFSGEGVSSDGQYVSPEDIPKGAKPLAGVVFKYLKVADIVQNTENSTVSVKYNITDSEVAAALGTETGLYNSDELADLLENINRVGNGAAKQKLEVYADRAGTAMNQTDEKGRTSKSDLDQGLYLLIEAEAPGSVVVRCNPFFVSIPMTNAGDVVYGDKTYEPGTLWQYDVLVYPKNKTEKPAIEKSIVKGIERDKYESAGIGDQITYEIKAELPANIANMSKFDISDRMSKGLTFEKIQKVKVGNFSLDPGSIPIQKPGKNGEAFVLSFIAEDQNLLAPFTGAKEVVITYTAVLNENCDITENGNENHASLIFNHNTSITQGGRDETVEDIRDPRVYTYNIDLEKVDKNGTRLADIEFQLYQEDQKTQIYVTQKPSSNPEYEGILSYYPNSSQSGDVIKTDKNGRAFIYGLAPGTYYLKETKTFEGGTLLKDMIKVVIREEVTFHTATDREPGTYVLIPTGNVPTYYKLRADGTYVEFRDLSGYQGKYVNFGVNKVYCKDGENYVEVEPLYYPTVKADISAAEPFAAEGMMISLQVKNNSGFDLPFTGGAGTGILVGGGSVMIMAALLILICRRKKAGRA